MRPNPVHNSRIPSLKPLWEGIPFATGFRIFFLSAAVHAVLSMILWLKTYTMGHSFSYPWALTVWHGYDMIFGYTAAVIAGFLLTAVMNWTGRPTLQHQSLFGLWGLWLSARIGHHIVSPSPWPAIVSCLDILFLIFLIIGIARPIHQAQQWKRQRWVFAFLILLMLGWALTAIGLFKQDLLIQRKGLRVSILAVVGLITVIGQRVIPFFTERGLNLATPLPRLPWLEETGKGTLLAGCFLFILSENNRLWPWTLFIAGGLLILSLVRWYRFDIWKRSLLWVLFAGFCATAVGLGTWGLCAAFQWKDDAALHLITTGGIGLMTLGMMCRVAWGHTGRPIHHPPRLCGWLFAMMAVAMIMRTSAFLLAEKETFVCLLGSQLLWILAFSGYIGRYGLILLTPRPDGRPG